MHSTGLSLGFWEFAIDTAVHTYNRTPQRSIQWRMRHDVTVDIIPSPAVGRTLVPVLPEGGPGRVSRGLLV